MTNQEPLLLGIDIGTTDTKCTFYTLNGQPLVGSFQEYSMTHPSPGLAEEDPEEWWHAVIQNIRTCLTNHPFDTGRVAGIGVSCTNTFFPVSKDGTALHPAILQIDQRTAEETEWIRTHIGEERIYQITGNRIARGTFSLPTIRWFVTHRPDLVEKACKFLVPSGYIICKLTGEFTINESRLGFTLLGNIRTGQWDESIAEAIGLPLSKLPRICKAYEIAGTVTKEAAQLTGLKEGTPVVGGAMDTVAAAVGAGAVHDNDIFLAMGTCGRLCYTSKKPFFDNRLMNCRNAFDGQWLSIEATNAAGASLRWFRDTFGHAVPDISGAAGHSIYEKFNLLASQSSPGANGLIYLPYLSGERCPIWNPYARGVFFGASFSTVYGDFVRSVMEGVAFSMRQGLEIILAEKKLPDFITLGGGIGNSHVWCQIFADVFDIPIKKLSVSETETLGDAILAGVGTGLIRHPDTITDALIQNSETILPNAENVPLYKNYFAFYQQLSLLAETKFPDLFRLQQEAMNQKRKYNGDSGRL